MQKEVKKKYDELAKKYKLPSFDSVNSEFEISAIDEESLILREVRRKMVEKIEAYNGVLKSILQPETDVSDMYECGVFSDEEKDKVFKLFKQLMFFNRLSVETSIDEDDKKTSQFINYFWKEWPDIKKDLSKIVVKLKESWLKEIKFKTDIGYLG